MNSNTSHNKPINQALISNYMYLGLLPFFACAFGPWVFTDYATRLVALFLLYSGIILVFLAGVLWAISLFVEGIDHRARHSHMAIALSLWPLGSAFLPQLYATGVMAVGFLWLLFWEKCFINPLYPQWYRNLRHKITFMVVACHMLTIWNLLRL